MHVSSLSQKILLIEHFFPSSGSREVHCSEESRISRKVQKDSVKIWVTLAFFCFTCYFHFRIFIFIFFVFYKTRPQTVCVSFWANTIFENSERSNFSLHIKPERDSPQNFCRNKEQKTKNENKPEHENHEVIKLWDLMGHGNVTKENAIANAATMHNFWGL